MAPESMAITAQSGKSPSPSNPTAAKTRLSYSAKLAEVVNTCTAMTDQLSTTIMDFWQVPLTLRFIAVSARNHYFWKADDFYVSQLPLDDSSDRIAQLRISDNACACLLNQTLGIPRADTEETAPPFRFDHLTNFEAQVLTDFSKELFSFLLKHLVSRRPPRRKSPSRLIHLVWALKVEAPQPGAENTLGKIVLTLPAQSLKLTPATAREDPPLPDELFFHAHATATVDIGQTRLPLEDLQHLEPGDIVILEKSRTDHLALIEPDSGIKLPFTAQITHHKSLEVPYTQELAIMEQQQQSQSTKDKLWNHLMIDVNAEFFPTRMPLDHLKQMSEGLIVEVGDLTQNRIRLHIEGKTVALGELVIVGEKFGVRISELIDESSSSEAEETMPQITSTSQAPASQSSPHPMESFPSQEQPEAVPNSATKAEGDDWLDDDFGDDDLDEDEW